MKLEQNYFKNLSNAKYRDYLKILPDMSHEKTRIITTLIMTFTAMSILGIFAINPTLSTIVTLNKQLEDSKLILENLRTKNSNLSSLLSQYNLLSEELPVVFSAVPKDSEAPSLVGQLVALSKQQNVTISSLIVSEVPLTGEEADPKGSSYEFTLQAQGAYENLIEFAKSLSQLNRIVTTDSIAINKDAAAQTLILEIKGRAYFKN